MLLYFLDYLLIMYRYDMVVVYMIFNPLLGIFVLGFSPEDVSKCSFIIFMLHRGMKMCPRYLYTPIYVL